MTPENGGKFELKLTEATTVAAEYQAVLITPAAVWRAIARVSAGSGTQQVDFGVWDSESSSDPPEWLTSDARAALKAALRTSQAEGRWPRRLTRWRPAPPS